MTPVLRKLLLIGIFIVPLIPLIVTSSLAFPFVTGKNFAFRVLIELLTGIWLMLAFLEPKYRPRFSWLLAALAIFAGVTLASGLLGVDAYRSFWSNFGRMEGGITLLHLFVYFLMAGSVLDTEKLWRRFLAAGAAVSAVIVLISLLQLAGIVPIYKDISEGRLDSTFGNAAFLAAYLLSQFFLTLYLLWQNRRRPFVRLVYGILAALSILVIYFTATRSALIGLGGGLLVICLLAVISEKERKKLRWLGVSAVFGILLLATSFGFLKNQNWVKESLVLNRFSQLSIQNLKQQNRYQLWLVAWAGVKERPLLGWGQENFYYVFQKHYQPAAYNKNENFSDRAHNLIFDWLIAGGFLGLLAFLSIFLTSLAALWHRRRQIFSSAEKYLLTGFFAAYFINNLFIFDSIATYILLFSALALIHRRQIYSSAKNLPSPTTRASNWRTAVVMTLVLAVTYGLNVRPLIAARNLAIGVKSLPAEPTRSYDAFTAALTQDSFGTYEIRSQLAVIVTEPEKLRLADQDLQNNFRELAEAEMKKQIAQFPNDALARYVGGSLLRHRGRNEEAALWLEQARILSPQKQDILLGLTRVYLTQKDYARALSIVQTAFESAPEFDDVRLAYAAAAIYAGDDKLAQELLLPRFDTLIVDNQELLRAYAETNQTEKAIAILRLRLAKDPRNLQTYASLAAGFFALGQRAQAIKILQQAIAVNPEFEARGEQWIEQIKQGRTPDLPNG